MPTLEDTVTDIRDLIFSYLSIPDLVTLHNASLQSTCRHKPSLAESCKYTGARRLAHLITKAEFNIRPVIDGELLVYKRNRCNETKYPRPRPFQPWDVFAGQFERTFTGNQECPKMRITEPCTRKINDPPSRLIYDPAKVGDNSLGPAEIVTIYLMFKIEDESTAPDLVIEYDTTNCTISDAIKDEDVGGGYYTRTISHAIPLAKVGWSTQRREGERKVVNGLLKTRDDLQIPKDWIEMLGNQVMARVVFRKRHHEFVEEIQNTTERSFILQAFELIWDINLSERHCRPDVFYLWRKNEELWM
jgi:hypothetical protein